MAQTTNVTTVPINITSGLTTYNNYIDNFYTEFDSAKDIVSNPSKLYINQIFNEKPTITLTPINASMSTGSHPTTNVPVLTAATGSTASSYHYNEMKSLLRGFNASTFYNDWYPVSSSGISQKVSSLLVLSFANNLIGDKLNIYSTNDGRFEFALDTNTYSVYNYTDTIFSGFTYEINNQYVNEVSNFGLIYSGSTATASNFKGLFFGQLGLLFFYTSSGTIAMPTSIKLINAVYQESLNSKTFFCRVTNEKYNASTNPTWVTYSSTLGTNLIRSEVGDSGHTYTAITGIGLYNDQGQLLAIAKLSQPALKLVDTELHARVVIQY